MMKKIYLVLVIAVALISLATTRINAQIDSSEIQWVFPELENYHEIIYPIWHDYYPAGNITKLAECIPEIKIKTEQINSAKLPGILRDKESKWKEGLNDLNTSANEYYTAATKKDSIGLMNAAEKLHAKYEGLVRIVKPLSKQIDAYHQSLYIIYHKYTPTNDFTGMAALMDDMINKAEEIYANVPKKMEAKKDEYLSVSTELINSTKELKEKLSTNDRNIINPAVEIMHTKYIKLENLF